MSVTGVVASTRRIGHAVWVERRLFEIVGAWVPSVEDAGAVALLAAQSRHHAWRADLLGELTSTFAGRTAAAWVACPHGSVEAALSVVADASTTATRVAALHRSIVPRLLGAYESILVAANPVCDAPAMRLVSIARDDLVGDRRRGDELVDRLADADGGASAAVIEARVAELVLEAGGLLGSD